MLSFYYLLLLDVIGYKLRHKEREEGDQPGDLVDFTQGKRALAEHRQEWSG